MRSVGQKAWDAVCSAGPEWLQDVIDSHNIRLGPASLIAVVHQAGDEGLCLAMDSIGHALNDLVGARMISSTSEVQKLVAQLERLELLRVERTPGHRNRYRLTDDPSAIVDPNLHAAIDAECAVLAAVATLFDTIGRDRAVAVLNGAIQARTGARA